MTQLNHEKFLKILARLLKNISCGNNQIDEIIKASQRNSIDDDDFLEWIEFDKLMNFKYISRGGIGEIYSAIWKDGPPKSVDIFDRLYNREGKCIIVVKYFKNNKEFFNELIKIYKMIVACSRASGLENLTRIYGVTRNDENENYGIVMKYLNSGSLEKYLEDNWEIITWKKKLGILKDTAHGLLKLHDAGLIHGDLHTRNIMISTNLYDQHPTGYIGDFGLCRTDESIDSKQLRNVIPYMAPELLSGEKYTKKADIYSFGLIMYQVATNTRPDRYRHYKRDLANDILNGRRPGFVRDLMPRCYENLMRNCWNNEKRSRPKTETLYAKFCEWEENYYELNSPFKNFRLQRIEPSGYCNGYV
ncbi:kinase-like domain-containing protein [Glomus cerebriforme]|uniref:Kinase-like domain-containing protein n=1 Tax=Glomus cerebriforme TaxID=658196 RepID=A0A397T8Y3_9GLOM|nr:kinase-like domain-containing protein [Glomus cerebriforme]